jgi:hypothetical protein
MDLFSKVFTQKGFFFKLIFGKEDAMLILQQVDCTLLKKGKLRIPTCGSTLSN